MPTTSSDTLRFENGAAYELGMGVWSRLVGTMFLDWLAPPPGLRWIDVGCGNGAFTELLMQKSAPSALQAIDPAEDQLAFARAREKTVGAVFQQADAMALPFEEDSFDAAAMALVIFFVPDPARGVAELARVVAPGGLVSAYAWDIEGGGLPFEPIRAEFERLGVRMPMPPNPEITREDALRSLWTEAGLQSVDTTMIAVTRVFNSFDDFWRANMSISGVAETFATLDSRSAKFFRDRVLSLLHFEDGGQIKCRARATAVRGRA